MIDPLIIQRIREDVSLLELAKEHGCVFRRQGSDWFSLCPFHVEKGGSFKVNEKMNKCKCFGCPAGGDVIQFYLDINGLDRKAKFPEAVRVLGARIGITVDGGDCTVRKPRQKRRTREEKEAGKELARAQALARRSAMAVTLLIEQHPWDFAQIWEDSPRRPDAPQDEAMALMRIFKPEDIVWCGDVHHSIQKEDLAVMPDDFKGGAERWEHWKGQVRRCFRHALEWVNYPMPGPRVCAAHFKTDSEGRQWSRSLTEVAAPRFLVVEHDKVPLDAQGALLRWLREKVGLRLRAIVFTGGKSLHGWFDYPLAAHVPRLRVMLSGVQVERVTEGKATRQYEGGMGFDAAIWNHVQPWKVPGHPHPKTGNVASLLWIE